MKNIEAFYPLSPMQQGMFFHSLDISESGAYLQQISCVLRGSLDVQAFEKAWQQVVKRHPVLRTSFIWEGVKETVQVVQRHAGISLEQQDWQALAPFRREDSLEELLAADRQRGFDLSKAPLMRLTLVRLDAQTHYFVWTHHHLLLDGWSVPLLLKEVFTSYEAARQGRELSLPQPRPYRDYIAWLRKQDLSAAERYWRETLRGFTGPTRLDLGRGSAAAGEAEAGERYAEQQVRLSAEATARLQRYARQQQVTVNTLVQGAWALLLARYSGRRDVAFGATVSGRPAELPGAEDMVGLFINTLPVRVKVDGGGTVGEWLRELQAGQVAARQYEHSPLADVQRWGGVGRGEGLFETLVVFENYPVDESLRQQNGSLTVNQLRAFAPNNYPATLTVLPGEELLLRIEYDGSRFAPAAVKRLLRLLETLLPGMVEQTHAPLKVLEELLDRTEADIQSVEKKEREEFNRERLFGAKPKSFKLSTEANS